MSDTTVLYAGVFCFALVMLGVALTVLEFRKLSGSPNKSSKPKLVTAPAATMANVSASRSG